MIPNLCRYPFWRCSVFLLNPIFCHKLIKSRFHSNYYFFQNQECSLENWVFANVARSEEMLHFFFKTTLDNFYVMEMNQTFESALLFWKNLIGRWVLLFNCKLLSKNQKVIDSIRQLKHWNYLCRKNRKRMLSYK